MNQNNSKKKSPEDLTNNYNPPTRNREYDEKKNDKLKGYKPQH